MFFTLSSPHLGLSFGDNKLVNLGVWFMTKANDKNSAIS